MINDIKLMMWKEWKQSLTNKELIPMLILPAYLGIVLPIAFLSASKTPIPIDIGLLFNHILTLLLSFVGSLSASVFVAYSFSGERENNTLPTLLSTRLSDLTLVGGKIIFALSVSILMCFFTMLFFIGTIVVMKGSMAQVGKMFASPEMILSPLLIPLFFSLLSISIGMLISTKIVNAKTASGVAFLPEVPVIALVGWLILGNPLGLTAFANLIIITIFLILVSVIFISLTVGLFSRERMITR
jgi:ABC-type transport system involved in multi-copper enzyme maturation permease subunit